MRRWRCVVTDIFTEQDSVIVAADTREDAAAIAEELVEAGSGSPVDQQREVYVTLYDEDDEEDAD